MLKLLFYMGIWKKSFICSNFLVLSKKGDQNNVFLLLKSLYGLKQSPRQWYKRFNDFMMMESFHRSKFDSCVYFKKTRNYNIIYLLLYVDDMLVIFKDMVDINKLKEALKAEFEMKDLEDVKKILGIDILRDRKKGILSLNQTRYIQKVLILHQ